MNARSTLMALLLNEMLLTDSFPTAVDILILEGNFCIATTNNLTHTLSHSLTQHNTKYINETYAEMKPSHFSLTKVRG